MERIKGPLYGVSVGPGDPELLPFKALRIMRRCPVIAAPQTKSVEMLAPVSYTHLPTTGKTANGNSWPSAGSAAV